MKYQVDNHNNTNRRVCELMIFHQGLPDAASLVLINSELIAIFLSFWVLLISRISGYLTIIISDSKIQRNP